MGTQNTPLIDFSTSGKTIGIVFGDDAGAVILQSSDNENEEY